MPRRFFLLASLAVAFTTPALAIETVDGKGIVERVRRAPDVVLVHVWATWCPSCRAVFDDLNEAASDYGSRGLTVLAFATDSDAAAVERYHKAHPAQWIGHHVADGTRVDRAIAELGGRYPGGIPYDLLLDGRGRVLTQWSGGLGRERLREILEDRLPRTPQAVLGPVEAVEQGRVRIVLLGREGDPVSIDGWEAGVLPLDTELVGGPHRFRVEGALGRVDVEQSVVLADGRVVEVDLGPAPVAEP